MATAKHAAKSGASRGGHRGGRQSGGWWRSALLLVLLCAGAAAWYWREPAIGYARAGTALGAHVGCSCRHIAGRELSDCAKDFEPGMELVFLSEDEGERSVTAWIPLIASDTARFHDGRGCLLDKWPH